MRNNKDLFISYIISLAPFIFSSIESFLSYGFEYIFGYFLYFGLYPLILIFLCHLFKTRKYHLTGISFALLMQYFVYMFMSKSGDTNGLVWLGYFFTIPGLIMGVLLSCYLIIKRKLNLKNITIGFLFPFLGFLLNHIALCNTLMYCKFISY